jgi:hypothetical protein
MQKRLYGTSKVAKLCAVVFLSCVVQCCPTFASLYCLQLVLVQSLRFLASVSASDITSCCHGIMSFSFFNQPFNVKQTPIFRAPNPEHHPPPAVAALPTLSRSKGLSVIQQCHAHAEPLVSRLLLSAHRQNNNGSEAHPWAGQGRTASRVLCRPLPTL